MYFMKQRGGGSSSCRAAIKKCSTVHPLVYWRTGSMFVPQHAALSFTTNAAGIPANYKMICSDHMSC